MKDQLTQRQAAGRRVRLGAGSWRAAVFPAAMAAGLAVAIFAFFYAAYPLRHLHVPVGFDPPYYVWRAEYLGSQGVGTGPLAARPGYMILSSLLGSVLRRPQLGLVAILSLVVVSLVALGVGAFVVAALGGDRWGWLLAVATTGIVLGPTHLVGENLSNTLNLALEVAALVPLAGAVAGGSGLWASVALLIGAGVAHWDFLALFEVVLVLVAFLAWPTSRRHMSAGSPFFHTEAGVLTRVGVPVAAIMGGLVLGVLRAPMITTEVGEDTVLYWKKFVRDLARLAVPAAAALGYWAAPHPERALGVGAEANRTRSHSFGRRVLAAWATVMVAGVIIGGLTLKMPPARFLALLVALPGAVAVGAAVRMIARWVGGRFRGNAMPRGRAIASGVTIGALLAALAIPALFRWYRYPPLLQESALQEAEVAGRYMSTLPNRQSVVFLVDYYLRPFPYGSVLGERTIRIELPAGRQVDAHFFVGTLGDLMAGRQTPPPNDRLRITTAPYRADVSRLLSETPPVVVLQQLAGSGFSEARSQGARIIGPGVAVLRGPPLIAPIDIPPAIRAVPSLGEGLLWGAVIVVLLGVSGGGWTRLFLSPADSAEAFFALAPVVGAAALVLGGLILDRVGVRLGGAGGILAYVLVSAAGWGAAFLRRDHTTPTTATRSQADAETASPRPIAGSS